MKVYLNRKDLHLLSRAQRLVEHTRTGFVATGDGPSPERFAVAAEEVAVATPGMPGDLRQLFAGEE